MPMSNWRPPPQSPSSYAVYPLEALDGVLAYVTLHGETVGYCFGTDEDAAAEAVAARMTDPVLPQRAAAASGD